jgi:hypothetical protein
MPKPHHVSPPPFDRAISVMCFVSEKADEGLCKQLAVFFPDTTWPGFAKNHFFAYTLLADDKPVMTMFS